MRGAVHLLIALTAGLLVFLQVPKTAAETLTIGFSQRAADQLEAALEALEAHDLLQSADLQVHRVAYGSALQARQAVQSGEVSLAIIPSEKFGEQEGADHTLPYLTMVTQPLHHMTSQELQDIQRSPVGEAGLLELERAGLVGISYLNQGQTQLFLRQDIKSVDDLRGMRIAMPEFAEPSPTVIEGYGANMVSLSSGSIVPALTRGVVDAFEFNPAGEEQIDLVYEAVVLPNFRPMVSVVVANEDAWIKFSERQKAAVVIAFEEIAEASEELSEQIEEDFLEMVQTASGLFISEFSVESGARVLGSEVYKERYGVEFEQAYDVFIEALSLIRSEGGAFRDRRSTLVPAENFASLQTPTYIRPQVQPSLFFITDRDEAPFEMNAAYRFGSNRNDPVLKCGIVHTEGGSSRTMSVGIEVWPERGMSSCIDFILENTEDSKRVLIFIHGFRNTFLSAIERGVLLYEKVTSGAPVIVWSWPSDGRVRRYSYDEESVRWSRPRLNRFVQHYLGAGREINLLTHSMGSRLAIWLVEHVKERGLGDNVNVIVFAAPDETQDIFRDAMMEASDIGAIKSLYASSGDWALWASEQRHDSPRAGSAGAQMIIVPGVDTIDASAFDRALSLNHGYVFSVDEILDDLQLQIAAQRAASERALAERRIREKIYWAIEPNSALPTAALSGRQARRGLRAKVSVVRSVSGNG